MAGTVAPRPSPVRVEPSPTPTYDARCRLWYEHLRGSWKPALGDAAEALIRRMMDEEDGGEGGEGANDMDELEASLQQGGTSKGPGAGLVVFVHVHDQVFPIPCGKGKQTFKWLALTACARYRQSCVARGRLRTRECGSPKLGMFNARSVSTPSLSSDDYIDPRIHLRDVLHTGDHVQVDLDDDRSNIKRISQRRNLTTSDHLRDEGETLPVLVGPFYERLTKGEVATFASSAFYVSDECTEAVTRLEKETKAEKERKEVEAKENAARLLFGNEASSATGGGGHDVDDAFEAEWKLLDFAAFMPIKREQDEMKVVMRRYYQDLRAVFRHYCQLHDGAEGDGCLDSEEFVAFAEASGIIDDDKMQHKHLQKVFERVNQELHMTAGGGMYKSKGDDKFTRSEFLESIIQIALMKYDKLWDDDPSTQFEELMEQHVEPHFHKVVPDDDGADKYKQLMLQPRNSAVLISHIDLIKTVFYVFGAAHGVPPPSGILRRVTEGEIDDPSDDDGLGGGGGGGGGLDGGMPAHFTSEDVSFIEARDHMLSEEGEEATVDMREFILMLRRAGMIHKSNLTEEAVKIVFIDSQHEEYDVKAVEKEDSSNLTRLTFVEFVEALMRCVDRKWQHTRASFETKLVVLMRFLARALTRQSAAAHGHHGHPEGKTK